MVRGKSGSASTPPRQAPKPSQIKKLAKEGEKETEAGPGHNSKTSLLVEDPDERQRVYYEVTQAVSKITAEEKLLKDKLKNFNEDKKQLFKDGKAKLGYNRKDFEYGISLRTSVQSEDAGSAALSEHRRRLEIAVYEEHPIALQGDLFGDPAQVDRTPSVERAYKAGKVAGLRGEVACTPPTGYGTPQAQEWMKGWHVGQEVLMRRKLKDNTTAPTEGGLWPDDPDANNVTSHGAGVAANLGSTNPILEVTQDTVNNIVPIGSAASTAKAL